MSYHQAKPRGQLFELPRGPEPEWVAEARRLRRQHWSYQRIADTLELHYRRVYVALNRERVRETNKRSNRRNQAQHWEQEKLRRLRAAPCCEVCSHKLSKPPRTLPAICRACRVAQGRRRLAVIAGLWLADYTSGQIAEALGESSPNTIATQVSQMRAAGWPLPRRRTV